MAHPLSDNDLVIAIRYATKDGIDAIDPITETIERLGHCWFAKFGQPVAPHLVRQLVRLGPERASVVLLPPKGAGRARQFHHFSVLAGADRAPPSGEYPAYYKDHLRWATTWLKVAPPTRKIGSLDDLMVRSSARPLTEALATSFRGHFLCVHRPGQG